MPPTTEMIEPAIANRPNNLKWVECHIRTWRITRRRGTLLKVQQKPDLYPNDDNIKSSHWSYAGPEFPTDGWSSRASSY